jgi:uncharacterized membrane protein
MRPAVTSMPPAGRFETAHSGGRTMPNLHVIAGTGETPSYPTVRKIGLADIRQALAEGIDDFSALPTHVLFLGILYPLIGLFLACLSFGYDVVPLLFPLASGFALVGPFAAVGLYELSRRREQGLESSWMNAFDVLRSPSRDAILALGFLLMAVFLIWLATAELLYRSVFGSTTPDSVAQFARDVLTTPRGWTLILAGNAIGFLFAVLVLIISVVSFPLLLDREVGAAVAIHTSIRAVLVNPVAIAIWGLIVAVALLLGSIPFFLGLAVVMPVLAHATWHLYRRVVEPALGPRPEYHPRPREPRYAADFPAALFPSRAIGAEPSGSEASPSVPPEPPAGPAREPTQQASPTTARSP